MIDERPSDEADRYRRAAEDALGQLEWCVGYLHRIRKTSLANALARNRTAIAGRLRDAGTRPPAGGTALRPPSRAGARR